MFFTICLYISLAIFVAGVLYKGSAWFRYQIDTSRENLTVQNRIAAAVKGVLATIFSQKLLILLKTFIVDVILQLRILRESFSRWLMHMLISTGFISLLLMHALEKIITEPLFPEYYSTLNPFFFLRDFFGFMVVAGLAIALYRRIALKGPRFKTDAVDIIAIVILAVVMVSGFLLAATKITSYSVYQEMVDEYAGTDDEAELEALESVWVSKFAVVSPNVKGPFKNEMIEQGLEIHQDSCMDCHADPQWAFGSFLTAKIVSPFALALDAAGIPTFLWYLHFLACFAGLAYLPFSKLFHLVTTPLSLLSNSVMDRTTSDPVNTVTRQILELDACTRCGTCSLNCSVAITAGDRGNENILPSIKIRKLLELAKVDRTDREEVARLQEGLYLCTSCYRCTTVCPSGINLQDLWFDARESLLRKGYPELLVLSSL
ncbi:MAG: (Fe-S)-binding protein, partial [Deltaproteobacteria bacterium]|nr:(Fe-S)-binding protein [Deltaproteobacteria bacterium]